MRAQGPKFNRPLREDREGEARFQSWYWGGHPRNGGFCDIDGYMHDGAEGRNRFLFVEWKPSISSNTVSQEWSLTGLVKLNYEAVTAILACCPATRAPESIGNPYYVAPPDSIVTYAIADPQFSWAGKTQQVSLWDWNRMIRHWGNHGNAFELVKDCDCCYWDEEDLQEVVDKVNVGLAYAESLRIGGRVLSRT